MTLPTAEANPPISWNVWTDVHQMLAFHFMVNALRACTVAAIVAGIVGWLMVLRRQTFAGHTLSVVSFPGAAAATWLGMSAMWGYFGFCVTTALIIGLATVQSRRSLSQESALIAVAQAFALALGFLFVVLYKGFLNETQSLLFGTFLGITDSQVLTLLCVSGAVIVVTGVLGRRLLFTSVDPVVASSRGIPSRLTGVFFLLTLGIAVAEISEITGALLVFALLVMPAAASQQITARPAVGVALSVALAVAIAWVGVTLSFYLSSFPTGFVTTTVGFGVYVTSVVLRTYSERRTSRVALPVEISPA